MRLDKFLSQAVGLPRSQVKRAIGKGRVSVDGERVTDPKTPISIDDNLQSLQTVKFQGSIQQLSGHQYIMLNKPIGYICAAQDELHPTALNLLEELKSNKTKLHFAGRLDQDTTGMVLITDDGQWSHQITSPRKKCRKSYLVETMEPISEESIIQLTQGIVLKGEDKPTQPAVVECLAPNKIRLTIVEGRYHQVKRMLAAVGNKVTQLHRESIGDLSLGTLGIGEWRRLTENEVSLLVA